jgi:signal transduction histidine kinase
MQIRTRLTILFVLLAAGILAAVLFGVYWMFKRNTENAFFKSLESKVEITQQTVLANEKALTPVNYIWVAPEDTLPYRDNVSIFDNSYTRIFTMRKEAVPVSARDLQDIYRNGETRIIHYNLHALGKKARTSNAEYVIVAEGYCDPHEIIELRNILIISFLLGIILFAATGWYYAGKALQPVSLIVAEVEEIQPSDLSRRLDTGNGEDELARMADAFNKLLGRVEQAFQMQRMFLSNVSHELRNPLTAIRAQLDVVLQRERQPEAYRTALQSVLDDIKDLSETEQRLLHLARVYNNPQSIPFEPIRLDELLWQTLDQFKKQYPLYHYTLEFGSMPAVEETLLVKANEPLLRLALINLMNNACKYSPDETVHVSLLFKDKGCHEILISDNGPGIPENEKALIFEPFYRSPRHLQVKGTGIGLSLAKSILNLHKIELSVESERNKGAVFKLSFN